MVVERNGELLANGREAVVGEEGKESAGELEGALKACLVRDARRCGNRPEHARIEGCVVGPNGWMLQIGPDGGIEIPEGGGVLHHVGGDAMDADIDRMKPKLGRANQKTGCIDSATRDCRYPDGAGAVALLVGRLKIDGNEIEFVHLTFFPIIPVSTGVILIVTMITMVDWCAWGQAAILFGRN